jgi:hypothetical protein
MISVMAPPPEAFGGDNNDATSEGEGFLATQEDAPAPSRAFSVGGGAAASARKLRGPSGGRADHWEDELSAERHPLAPDPAPYFITPPGETDWMLVNAGVILVLAILGVGALFFRLHTLPERLAHRSQKLQFELVAVLGLLALFTHQHAFWVAGLLLALIDLPDVSTPVARIADALDSIAGRRKPEAAEAEPPHDAPAEAGAREAPHA